MINLFIVAGARPNFMKIAPIVRALRSGKSRGIVWKIIHTGQHYDYEMSQVFFDDLEIPEPDFFLEAGSGSHAVQTAEVMVAFEKVCVDEKPDLVIVVGDVNSTLACSVVAKKPLITTQIKGKNLTIPEHILERLDKSSEIEVIFGKSGH